MNKNNYLMCISCPVAHIFLSEYKKILTPEKREKKSYQEMTEAETEQNKSIKKLSNLFSLSFNEMENFILPEQKKQAILELDVTPDNTVKVCCLKRITSIIRLIEKLSPHSKNIIRDLCLFNEDNIKLLIEIENFLDINNIKPDCKRLTEEEKNWSNKFLNSIGIIERNKCYIPKEKISESEEVGSETTYYKMVDLVDCYVDNIGELQLQYQYCNEAYKNNALLKNIAIKEFKKCQDELFFKEKPSEEPSKEKIVILRINKILNEKSNRIKAIMCNYLKKAKKQPMFIIDSLMKKQRITDTDIAILLYNNSSEKDQVTKWHNTSNSKKELPKEANLQLKKLARIFLVSEEVLYCGTGKIYGNWKIALDENKNTKFREELLTPHDIEELDKIKIPRQRRPSLKVKEHIYERIRTFINQTDDNFKTMISENPEFFYEEDICLFTDEINGKEYYDYGLMYENLLHPEDFDTLISILENL